VQRLQLRQPVRRPRVVRQPEEQLGRPAARRQEEQQQQREERPRQPGAVPVRGLALEPGRSGGC
jgi:hypothetical protein